MNEFIDYMKSIDFLGAIAFTAGCFGHISGWVAFFVLIFIYNQVKRQEDNDHR